MSNFTKIRPAAALTRADWHGEAVSVSRDYATAPLAVTDLQLHIIIIIIDVEYIYGFVWWGVCKQSRRRHSVTEPSQDSGYVLLWQRYDNNKVVSMRYYGNVSFCCWRCVDWACYRCILHLQQYSHRLNLFFLFIIIIIGAFAKLRKATISFVMSVCPSAWDTTIPTGRILIVFDIWVFFENLSRKFKFD